MEIYTGFWVQDRQKWHEIAINVVSLVMGITKVCCKAMKWHQSHTEQVVLAQMNCQLQDVIVQVFCSWNQVELVLFISHS